MTREDKFNKWFGVFIMVGMTLAVCTVTVIQFHNKPEGRILLLLSAFASLMGVVGTVTSATGKICNFFFNFFDVAIYGIVCIINWYNGASGLGSGLLHLLYFVPMQFVGYVQWTRRSSSKGQVQPRRLTYSQRWLSVGVFAVMSMAIYIVLARFDKSAASGFIKVAVVLDVLPMVCNIIGQFLMSTAYMEQWVFWIGVNIFSIIMWTTSYVHTSDSFTLIYIIKYCFFLLNCCNGYRVWLRLSDPKKASLKNS